MTRMIELGLTLLLLGSVALPACVRASLPLAESTGSSEVHVGAPTGERDADRASILAALEQVRPGGTVRFAPGTYLIGPGLEVTGTRVTLLGHPDGTTIRGCDPAEFADFEFAVSACNALALSGGHQTVRFLTFEYAWHGLYVGCCLAADLEAFGRGERHQRPQVGGHLIEDNTFRYTPNGLRVVGESPEPTLVRNNRFIDVYHAIGINGRTVHFLNNDVSVQKPERVPYSTHPGDAINISPYGSTGDHTSCADNLVVGNRIEGNTHGIRILLLEPGTSCHNNVIRDNTIAVRRVRFASHWWGIRLNDEADSTVVGVPLSLMNLPATSEGSGPGHDGVIEDNLIEGNRIVGAEGVGIEVLHASRNRIAGNTVSDVARREPFPGNVLEGEPLEWRTANGAGIWISPGSEGNSLEGNVFEGIAGASVVREGELETADGVRLYYRVDGEGPETVVVLHGGPSLGHGYLAPDLVPLTRGRAVVHYDQRGIGRSTPLTDPERLSVERHVEDLEALRTHFGLERLALLGHSWGGMLAARYAAAHPQRVARILLLEPMAPARDPFMAIAGARAQEIVSARLDETERARLDSLIAETEVDDAGAHCGALFSLLRPIFFGDPAATTRSRADFCAGTPETLRIRSEVDAAILGSLGAWDVRPAVGDVTSPVLVLHGAAGAISREAMEAWADAFPNARLITIDRAGHYLHVDRPEAFFPAAEVFFGGGWPEAKGPGSGTVSGGETAPNEHVDVQAVESAIRGYLDAYAAMDPALLRAWTTDDFLLIANGYTAGFDRLVEGMDPAGALPFTHYPLQDLEIEVAGAIAVYRLVVDWYRGEARADGGIGTGHLRRAGDGWKLDRDHMTLLPGRRRVAAETLRGYAGEYRGLDGAGGNDRLHLEVDGERLFMTRPDGRPLFGGIRRLELIPESGEGFHLEFWGGLVEFERGDGDEIETLVYVPPLRMPAAYRQPLRYGRIR